MISASVFRPPPPPPPRRLLLYAECRLDESDGGGTAVNEVATDDDGADAGGEAVDDEARAAFWFLEIKKRTYSRSCLRQGKCALFIGAIAEKSAIELCTLRATNVPCTYIQGHLLQALLEGGL